MNHNNTLSAFHNDLDLTLKRIALCNPRVNAFSEILTLRSLETATALDRRSRDGQRLGTLAGIPFGAKSLIDIANVKTRAGSAVTRDDPEPKRDAAVIENLESQGAILVGALHMGEFAYDFTGENRHFGPTRNPHSTDHMSGGSSGGSAAAVAAGMIPFSLASDTNGSIRIPSSFCGVFGLRPTLGTLSTSGCYPFVRTLDTVGPIAKSVSILSLVHDAMKTSTEGPNVDETKISEPTHDCLLKAPDDLRVAVAGGYFLRGGDQACVRAVYKVAHALGATTTAELPSAEGARYAAQIITAAEAAILHADHLRMQHADFDPIVRDRLIAASSIPATFVERARLFSAWFQARVTELFERVDVLLAPAAPCRAPRIGEETVQINGRKEPLRPLLGLYAQPISLAGLPVVTVPVWLDDDLPLGVQIITAPMREDVGLRVAAYLERTGTCRFKIGQCQHSP